jgi:hypothetical protein
MSTEKHPIWDLVYAIEMDHRALGAKLQELRMAVASANLPMPTTVLCPECGIALAGPRSVAEHRYRLHDGERPSHWKDESELAD